MNKDTPENKLLELSKMKHEIEVRINERVNLDYSNPHDYLSLITNNDKIVIANIKRTITIKQINSISGILGLKCQEIHPTHEKGLSLVFYEVKKEFEGVE